MWASGYVIWVIHFLCWQMWFQLSDPTKDSEQPMAIFLSRNVLMEMSTNMWSAILYLVKVNVSTHIWQVLLSRPHIVFSFFGCEELRSIHCDYFLAWMDFCTARVRVLYPHLHLICSFLLISKHYPHPTISFSFYQNQYTCKTNSERQQVEMQKLKKVFLSYFLFRILTVQQLYHLPFSHGQPFLSTKY